MKITIAQINPTVGDIDGNLKKITDIFRDNEKKTDLVVFPELSVTGYPPRDLLEKPGFIEKTRTALEKLREVSAKYPGAALLAGAPTVTGKKTGKGLYNSAVLISGGKVLGASHKALLPAYDVFDETRYFDPSPEVRVIPFKDQMLGISVCEDMWNDPGMWPKKLYATDPIDKLKREGATVLINISASPFHSGKEETRYKLIRNHAMKYGTTFIFVNQVGGNDELVFDGRSMCIDGNGEPVSVLPSFEESVETVDTEEAGDKKRYVPDDGTDAVYRALVLGLRDYMRKCGFSKAVVGLSGGVDSSLVACIARDAVGGKNVLGVAMPSPYSSPERAEYSEELARKLGIDFKTLPISDVYHAYIGALKNDIAIEDEEEVDVTMQNIQARIRGNFLMAFSNKFGYLLLTTGNKSELAVGYCTLYGDMAGGLAVISDVPKTMVYRLAGHVNREFEIIPRSVIDRPPSAELRPGQLDQDTLPPYEALDGILQHYLEDGHTEEQLLEKGFARDMVSWVMRSVNRNEYKRRQTPMGLKVTSKAFGSGRRMPIAAKYDF